MPVALAVTLPLLGTLAMPVWLLLQVTVRAAAPVTLTSAVSVFVPPASSEVASGVVTLTTHGLDPQRPTAA